MRAREAASVKQTVILTGRLRGEKIIFNSAESVADKYFGVFKITKG